MNGPALPSFVRYVIETLEKAGFEAYAVGGCVRDFLLSRTPADWDVASSAAPESVMRLFEKTVPTGAAYGTVTVLLGAEKVEVTAFRTEDGYADHRRPKTVRFCGGINDDLARRDFTVNAMAYHPERGLTDPFGGRADLTHRLIRAVGVPETRFGEDALRILRAFRFAATLDFDIDPKTLDAAEKTAGLVSKISGERVRAELEKTLVCAKPEFSLRLVKTGALAHLDLHARDVAHSAATGGALAQVPPVPFARWAAFFWFLQKKTAAPILGALHFDNRTKTAILWALRELALPLPVSSAKIKCRLSQSPSPEDYRHFLRLFGAMNAVEMTAQIELLDRILANGEPYTLRALAVSGKDLLAAGVPPGPVVGKIMNLLLAEIIEDPTKNSKKQLLSRAKQLIL